MDKQEQNVYELAGTSGAETSGDVYVHHFRKPFSYEGNTYKSLTFDWGKLTGADSLAIERELAALGAGSVFQEFSGEYQIRMAARACTEKISIFILEAMPLWDCRRILGMARSFLLGTGSSSEMEEAGSESNA